ncbi:MAG: hypothetical protein SO232_04345 [Candidatus Onthovivens sp.]|nr:hypothetical protein [Mycoplasmatota bacterium]MDY4857840.1 hypothetical protein [Candidatus Onthovivens sp.]
MKIFKKTIIIIFSLTLILNINLIPTYAISNKDPNIELLKNLNDPNWNEFIEEIDLNSNSVSSGEFYMKVYEDPNGLRIDNKTYTVNEYLMQNMVRADLSSGTNWIKFFYSTYPQFNDPEKISLVGGFEWMQTPNFQYRDIFTISSNGSIIIPGVNERVNVAYWPNISAPTVVGSYTTGDSHIEFDTYGISAKLYLAGYEFSNQILNLDEPSKYFSNSGDSTNAGYYTLGCPKGLIGFTMRKSDTTTTRGKLTFTYNHRQFILDFEPSVNVSSEGEVTINFITGQMGYDKASNTIDYTWGEEIP